MKSRFVKFLFLLLIGLSAPGFSVFASTVLSGYKYAWSDNVGYINFENVIVSNQALSGYAWSKNSGWIKLNPEKGRVVNSNGHLSGYAWGEQLGWINFEGVSIDTSTGKFSGTATGDRIGTLTFNCPNYCDVRTDWRLASGGGIPIFNPKPKPEPEPEEPKHIETYNQDLSINPQQSGRYTKDTDKGQVVVNVPAENVAGKTTFFIIEEPLSSDNKQLVLPEVELINSAFYNVFAKDQSDNFIHSFALSLTITLPVPTDLQKARNLGVYWLNETNSEWVLIPDAVFANNAATFQVDHLTKFAIFGDIENKVDDSKGGAASGPKTTNMNDASNTGNYSNGTKFNIGTNIKNNVPRPSLPIPGSNTTNLNPEGNSLPQNNNSFNARKQSIVSKQNFENLLTNIADRKNRKYLGPILLFLLALITFIALLLSDREKKDKTSGNKKK